MIDLYRNPKTMLWFMASDDDELLRVLLEIIRPYTGAGGTAWNVSTWETAMSWAAFTEIGHVHLRHRNWIIWFWTDYA